MQERRPRSQPSFQTYGDTVETDSGPQAAGDFNNDGKSDLIQCCNASTQFVFRAGNGDGNLDLVAVAAQNPPPPPGSGYSYLTIWLGNGDGTFQAAQTYNTTQSPNTVMMGNFFSDGHPDIAVADSASVIDLFRNQGNGNFAFVKSVNMGGGPYTGMTVAAGDLNGTGVSDLAVMQLAGTNNGINFASPQQLYVLWNDGQGNFTAQLYIDGQLIVNNLAQCTSDNYCYGGNSYVQTTQNLSAGSHLLVFKVWDTAGAVYQAQQTITVN